MLVGVQEPKGCWCVFYCLALVPFSNSLLETMMQLTKAEKESLFQAFGARKSAQDTGSTESQVALFTHRIKLLTHRLATHKKDKASRLGLTKLVSKRKRLLSYLKREDLERYRAAVASLGLRK